MTNPEFEALVSRLETYADRSPCGYRVRVALLACLGYASLAFVLALVLALIGGVIAVIALPQHPVLLFKVLIGPLALAATLLRSLKVTLPEPTGLKIERADAPLLFDLLEELRGKLNAPKFHQVLLTREMNAAVLQVPRFGMFGPHRNFLILGLPLMQALTPEQFKAVVAHEVGHMSGSHSRFGGWIHRVRRIWVQVLENLQADKHRRAAAWLGRFFGWYAPYFSAYTFVLARQNEYEADQCAAEITGPPVMAQALIALQVRSRFWEDRFWPEINKQVEQTPQPPPVFTTFGTVLRSSLLPEEAQAFFQTALGRSTSTSDTHPSLTDRLSALGCRSDSAQAFQQIFSGTHSATAADCYFPPASLPRLLNLLEEEWRRHVCAGWEQRYRQVQEGRQALAALDERALLDALSETERWDRANLTMEFGEVDTAIALFQEIVETGPARAEPQMALGLLLLRQGDASGLASLEAAMECDPGVTLSACQRAFEFCRQQGLEAEAEHFRQKAAARHQILLQAQAERETVGNNARFEAHGLPPDAVAALVRQLTGCREIRAAYLVRKKVAYLPEHPLYVLWLVPPFVSSGHQALANKIAPQIKFPGQMRIRVADGSDLQVLKIRRSLPAAQIYRRGR